MAKRGRTKAARPQIETPKIIGDAEAPKALQIDPIRPPDGDWFSARIAEVHLQKQMVADKLGMHPNLLHKLLSGERRCQIGEAIALARMLKVPKAEIVARLGFDWPRDVIRITGRVGGRGYVSPLPPQQQFEVECPFEYEADSLSALTVDAAHSALGIYHGMTVYYSPSPGVSIEAFGRLSVIEAGEHQSAILGSIDRASHGKGTVVVFGGIEVLHVQTIISASPVRWLKVG